MKLTKKQEAFIQEYLTNGFNATQAYLKAGYKVKNENTAAAAAQRLLKNVKIQQKIQEELAIRRRRYEATTENIIKELSSIAFSDLFNLVRIEPDGTITLKSIEQLSEIDRKAVQSITYDAKNGSIKIKMYSKEKALELLGKHLGLFEGERPDTEQLSNLKQIIQSIKDSFIGEEGGENDR